MPSEILQSYSQYSGFVNTMNDIQRAKREVNNTMRQISSGKKAQTYQALSALGIAEGTIDNQSRISVFDAYIQNNTVVQSKLEAADLSIDNIIKKMEEFVKLLVHKRSAGNMHINLTSNSESCLNIIRDNLNIKAQGKYLFSGSRVNIEPVRNLFTTSNIIKGEITDNYYQGDNIIHQAKISDSAVISYGLLASDPAFQKTVAVFHMAIEAEEENDDAILAETFDTAQEAIEGLVNLRTRIRDYLNQVSQTKDNIENTKRYYSERLSESTATQIEEAAAKLMQDQLILQGTYQVYGQMAGLSLVNYLK